MFFITAKSSPTVWPNREMQGMTMALIFSLFAKRYANTSAMHSILIASRKKVSVKDHGTLTCAFFSSVFLYLSVFLTYKNCRKINVKILQFDSITEKQFTPTVPFLQRLTKKKKNPFKLTTMIKTTECEFIKKTVSLQMHDKEKT